MAGQRTSRGTWAPGSSGNPNGRKAAKITFDGWGSAMTGIGDVLYDKRKSHDFSPVNLTYEKCVEIFEGDDLGKRAAYGPVEDAFSQGYEVSITDDGEFDDLKEDVENRMRELEVDKVVKKAIAQKRALGGAAILIGVRDNKSLDQPLDLKRAKNIDFLTNLEPMDLLPHSYYIDPLEPKFGDVKLWELRSLNTIMTPVSVGQSVKTASSRKQAKSRNLLIHESRLVIFNQTKISRYSSTVNPAGDYWGLSIYVQIYEILRDFNVSWAAAGLLMTDFSQSVFSIDNLMHLVAKDPQGLRDRMLAMQMGRSVARAILIDSKEKFENQTTNVTGLSDLLIQISRRFAASVDIPLTVLMGGGAKSDQAEPGDELRYYYDKLGTQQRDEIGPVLRLFAEIIMRGLRQRRLPKRWGIKWPPLWKLTDEQLANARLAQARVDAIYIKHGVLDPDTVARLRFGGEYSFDTNLPPGYEAPGFMALPPGGVLVEGNDPNTGLLPGEQPDAPKLGTGAITGGAGETGAHGVSGYNRRNPRQTSMTQGGDPTAGGDVPGELDAIEDDTRIDYIEKRGEKWAVISKSGEVLGEFATREEALKRLRQIEYFKHK